MLHRVIQCVHILIAIGWISGLPFVRGLEKLWSSVRNGLHAILELVRWVWSLQLNIPLVVIQDQIVQIKEFCKDLWIVLVWITNSSFNNKLALTSLLVDFYLHLSIMPMNVWVAWVYLAKFHKEIFIFFAIWIFGTGQESDEHSCTKVMKLCSKPQCRSQQNDMKKKP